MAVALALVIAATPGFAAPRIPEEDEHIVLAYDVPKDCPSREQFENKVRELEPRASFHEHGGVHFLVRVEKVGRKYQGTFTRTATAKMDESTGAETRSLSGESCGESTEALAFVAALAFTELSRKFDAARENAPIDQAEAKPSPPAREAPAKAEDDSPKPLVPSAPPEPSPSQLVNLRLRASSALGSGPLFGVDLGFEYELPLGRAFRMGARLGGGYARSNLSELTLEAIPYGALSLCPVLFRPERVVVGLCVELTHSRIVSNAVDRTNALPEAARAYSLLGAFVRAGTLVGPVALDLGLGLETSLVAVEYRLVGTAGVSSDPIVLSVAPGPAALGVLSVGYRIP